MVKSKRSKPRRDIAPVHPNAVPHGKPATMFPPAIKRLVPDVSLPADPDEGAFLVLHGQVQTDRWDKLERAGLGGLLRIAQRRTGEGSEALVAISQSTDLSADGNPVLPRH
jgi:hypothetical protein